ncbi:Gfo/Idh/MocA family protein [Bradyrhizobium sp. STM 3562]|uniref:Gfo/Idh/MocA family protein n=1 Tax=Bradyrhizobium sp. STM 3562 TaxID=578924 RepID=UPI003891074F
MVNLGLIGLGKMGLSHLAILNTHPSAKLIGVCDSASYLCNILHKYSGIKVFSSYREMLDDKSLDGVIVATPSRSHGEIVREALLRGLHVFCEKPFCLNVAEGSSLAELADRKGVVNQVGYHHRFVEAFKEAKRLLDAQALGRLHHVRVEAYGPVVLRPKGATWRSKGSEGGGCLYDYACHAIDLVNYLVGRPDAVSGTVLNRVFSRDVDDEVYATLHFADGMTGMIAANWSDDSLRRMSTQVTLWGTNGRMVVDRQELKTYIRAAAGSAGVAKEGWEVRYTTDFHSDVWYYLRGEEYSAQLDYFLRCIVEGRRDNISSFASAVQTDCVVSAMLQDARDTWRPVDSAPRGPAQSRTQSGGLLSQVTAALK